jgi:phosphopantetheine--protein transferase-like protein
MVGCFRGEVSASGLRLELASLDSATDWKSWLTADEVLRADGMANPVLQARFVVSRGLRRKVLAEAIESCPQVERCTDESPASVGTAGPAVRTLSAEGQRPAGPAGPTEVEGAQRSQGSLDLQFVEDPGIKPRLQDPDGWDFNASHAGDYVVLVVGRGEVGVDLERIRPVRDTAALVDRYFHSDEAAAWRNLPAEQKEGAFFILWSAREAAMKCAGTGLAGGLGQTRIDPEILRSDRIRGAVGGKEMILQREKAPEGYMLVTARTVS